MHIIIPGQTRAKKNSMKVITFGKGKNARYSIKSSDIYTAWEKKALAWVKHQQYPVWTGSYPIEVKFFLFREDKRKWDIDNVYCGSLDILQQAGIIADDTANHVIPVFSGWAIDRKNPRVELLLCAPQKTYYREDLYVGK